MFTLELPGSESHLYTDIGSGANKTPLGWQALPPAPSHANMADDRQKVPTWNGVEEGWTTYLEEVEWFFWETPQRSRHLIAAKLARKLTGSARNAIKGLRPADFSGVNGITKLLEILQERVGDLPVPDLANRLDEFVFRLKRRSGETMGEWGLRSVECYRHLTIALERVQGKTPKLGDYNLQSTAAETWNTWEEGSEGEQPEEGYDQGGFPWPTGWEPKKPNPTTNRPGKNGARSTPENYYWDEEYQCWIKWTTTESEEDPGNLDETSSDWRTISSWKSEKDPWAKEDPWASRGKTGPGTGKGRSGQTLSVKSTTSDDKSEWLPTEIRGWLLLRNSGLRAEERATIIASI